MSATPSAPPNSRTVSFSAEATPWRSSGKEPVIASVPGLITARRPTLRSA